MIKLDELLNDNTELFLFKLPKEVNLVPYFRDIYPEVLS